MAKKRLPAGLTIRAFRMADYAAVAELWRVTEREVDSRERVRLRLRRDRDLFLVAEIEGRIVGSVMGGWDGRYASVWRLAVHPEFRRSGIARALMAEIERRLQQKGAQGAFLLVWHENRPALRLYRKIGYTDHPGVVFMHKELCRGKGQGPCP